MFANLKRKAEEDAQAPSMANGDRKAAFTRNLAALNSQFAAWVAEQSNGAPKELWTDGVEDYLKYAKQLLADYADVLQDGGSAGATGAAGGGTPAAGLSFGAGKPPLAPGALFGSGGGGAPASAPASIFGALPPAVGGFGAGSTPGSAANSGGSGLFNVPSTGTLGSSFGGASGGEGEDEEGGEGEEGADQEPSLQVEAGEGTEMLAKQRAKLMSMSPDKKWKDKGQGTLTLRRPAPGDDGAPRQPYFVFTTDSGRVLINAPLVKSMKPMSNAKVPTSVIMFLISCVDGKEERAMHMFKCESADAAKQLMQTIQTVSEQS